MKITFTKSTTNFGCYVYDRHNAQHQFIKTNDFSISDVLNADVPLKDKAWFIRNNCQLTTEEYRKMAIGCALIVLPIYEAKHPKSQAPREAIQAAQDYLNGLIEIEELRIKRSAAYAADAYAAYAAAHAAHADDAAAAAYAAYAAAAAYDAADDYAAAYADVSYKDLLLQFFKDFTKE